MPSAADVDSEALLELAAFSSPDSLQGRRIDERVSLRPPRRPGTAAR